MVHGPPVAEDEDEESADAGSDTDTDTDTDGNGNGDDGGADDGGADDGGADDGGADDGGADDGGADDDGADDDGADDDGADDDGADDDGADDDLDGEGDLAAEGAVSGPADADPNAGGPVDTAPRSPSSGAGPDAPSRYMAGPTPGAGAGLRTPAEGTPAGARVEPLGPVGPVSGERRSTALGAGS